MEVTKEAERVLQSMRTDSLYWEAKEIVESLPENTKVCAVAMFWPAFNFQNDGDLAEAVADYLSAVGDRYISNAFSLSMIPEGGELMVSNANPEEIFPSPAYPGEKVKPTTSVVGHADTATLFSTLLGREIAVNRVSVTLKRGDVLYVGQYSGPRLPEGVSTLPQGAAIAWKKVVVK
jgi:hypothetical protein